MGSEIKPIIFGASGFIGKHLTQAMGLDQCMPLSRYASKHPHCMTADLLIPSSLTSLFNESKLVINLAYSSQLSADENITMAKNLIAACLKYKIKTLIHCSTAIVVGNNPSLFVNEEAICFPETDYERTKLSIEKIFLEAASEDLKVFILRPTGVIGVGGQNLKKMLSELMYDSFLKNYIRTSLYQSRPLNLVPVQDVVRALLHFCEKPSLASGIYICAADDDPDNHYLAQATLMRTLLNKELKFRSIRSPQFLLNTLLRMKRSGSGRHPYRQYSNKKLLATGFQRSLSISDAIKQFVLSEINP